MKAVNHIERRVAYPLVLGFAILASVIVAGGIFYYRHYEQQFRAGIEDQLSAITDLKVSELVQYRKERLGDAATFFKNAAFSGLARRFLDHPEDTNAQAELRTWLDKFQTNYQYDRVFLLDAQGVERMSTPATAAPVSAVVSRQVGEVLQSREIVFQDFHRHEHNQQIYLTLLVPILNGPDHDQALGVLALRIDPATYLYPFISRWPTHSRTAETLLVRREGNEAVFLNELKFQTNTALRLRISLDKTDRPAVKAALGQEGIVEGFDYRGVPVIADVRTVPGSPWFLVARMDIAEVFAPLRERLWLSVCLVGILLLGAGAATSAIWRHQRVQFYKDRAQVAEVLRESEERFRRVFEEGPIGMTMLDQTFRFIRVNPAFAAMLGYSIDELQTMAFTDVTHPDHVQKDVDSLQRLLRGELSVYCTEKQYIARSGKEIWGLVHVSVVRNAAGAFRHFLAIISDITERKRAEMAQRESEERMRSHTDNSPMAVVEWNADLIIMRWTGAAEKMFGWNADEAVGKSITQLPGIYEEDLPVVQGVIRQLTEGRSKHIVSSNRNRTRKGQVIHCEWYSSVLHDAGGKTVSVLSQVLDITERKQAEAKLAKEQELFQTLLKIVPDNIYFKDRESRFVQMSRSKVEDTLKTVRDDYRAVRPTANPDEWPSYLADIESFGKWLIGKSDYDTYPEAHARAAYEDEQEIIRTGKPIIGKLQKATLSNGKAICWFSTKLPWRNNDGNIVGTFGISRDVTPLKEAEEALAAEQRLLNNLITATPDLIYFKDRESRFTRINEAFVRRHGLSGPSVVLGKTDFDLFGEEHARQAYEDEKQIMATGEPIIGKEEREDWKDGRVTWVSSTKMPLHDGRGKIVGIMGISRDITEAKRAEEALRESQALYFSLVEQLPVGIFRKDPAGRYVLVNPGFCRLKDMKAGEFLGKTPQEVAGSERAQRDRTGLAVKYAAAGWNHHEQIMQTGKTIELVEEYTDANGRKQFVRAMKLPVFNPDGKVIGTQGVLTDITEIKRAEDELRRSNEALARTDRLLQAMLDNIPDWIYFKDTESRILKMGRTLAKAMGMADPEEAVGKTDFDFREPDQAREFYEDEQRIIRSGEPLINKTEKQVLANGEIGWTSTTKVPLRDPAGKVVGLVGINRDITQQKRAEEELRLNQERLLRVITQTRCILNFGQVEGPDGWRERALNPVSPFHWDFPVENEEAAQKVVPLELAPGERYQQAWTRSRNRADNAQMNWNSGNAFLNDLPFYRNEFRCTDKNGVGHWMQQFVTVRKLAENRWEIFGITTDISDLKRVETELRESQALYHSLVNQMPAGVFRKDREGRYVLVNDWFCTYNDETGVKPEDFLGRTSIEMREIQMSRSVYNPQQHIKFTAQGMEDHLLIMRTGQRIDAEEKHVYKDGTERYLRVAKTPVFDPEGRIIGSQGVMFDITDQKRAEEELLESQALYHSLVEQMPAGVFRKDPEGRFIFVNSVFCRIKETTPEQYLGKMASELKVSDIQLATRGAGHHATIMQSGNQIVEDEIYRRADGEIRNYQVMKSPVFDSAGKIVGTQGILFDITDRKRAEELLHESQALYHSLVEQMPAGVFRKNPEGRYVFVNSTFCRLKEMTRDQFLGKTALELELADVELKTKGADHHATIMQTGIPIVQDEVYRRADGTIRNYQTVKSPVLDSARKIVGTQGILFDITDRKRVEEALRRSETELHVTLESTADGVLAVDSKGKVIIANRRFAEIWRIPPSLMGAGDDRALLDFATRQLSDPDAFLKKVQSLYDSDAVEMDTLAFKDGRIFERYTAPMIMEGAVIGRVWSFRDITERKRQEEELKQKNTELERFTYTVSHDLKSPLVTVKTFLGYLEQDLARPDPERVKQDVGYMHTATQKMGQLLDELLNLARIGRKSNPSVRVTFQELVQEVVRLGAGRISQGGVKVQVADAAVVLEGDRPRLMEIWQNLVENACKFMGNQPKPQIEIGVEQRGRETVFFVRDNGVGIEPRFQAKVFGLFEKLDPKGEGTGMGLALVKRIVGLYQGRIWVESAGPGQGTNFLFTLPGAVIVETDKQ